MPELPEVETMVRDLAPRIVGRSIQSVEAAFPAIVIWPAFNEVAARASGETITAVNRRAKYAICTLSSGDILILHRGMSGSVLHRQADEPHESHVRVIFGLDDGTELRFRDPRKFGKIYLMHPSGAERSLPWSRMGPEPLNGDFQLQRFRATLRHRTGRIKPLLLNQGLVAGLGNIYADEALYVARIHPERRANTLSSVALGRLHRAIQSVLSSAIEGRGTTFSTYTDIEGRAGQFQARLQAYGRTGEPCSRCGSLIVKTVLGGRGTHFCPRCQKG